jgi:hypothetical protein
MKRSRPLYVVSNQERRVRAIIVNVPYMRITILQSVLEVTLTKDKQTVIEISFSRLDRAKMRVAKAEAKAIDPVKWMDIYYERNLADPELHYEGQIPKDLTSAEFDSLIFDIDESFKMLLVSI